MEKLSINNIHKKTNLNSETEYERATSLYLKLRKSEKEDSFHSSVRKHLRKLIKEYEAADWAEDSEISNEQIKESDLAESLVQAENRFSQKRKELIKNKLKSNGLNQNDLAKILGHTKGYTSELVNGLRPFSKEDVIVINRLFKIELSHLIPTFIKREKAARIKKVDIPVILTPHSGHTDPPMILGQKDKNVTKLQFFSQGFSFQFDSVGSVYQSIQNGIGYGGFSNDFIPTSNG